MGIRMRATSVLQASEMVRVEFYGLARLRAGRAELLVDATTIDSALESADAACPELRSRTDSGLSPEYRVSVGGRYFTDNPAEPLADGESLLVLGADAGG
jgi:molybdopterin converting factor small subunit